MNLSTMESLVRSTLNKSSNVILTQAEIFTSLNDGYKEVSSRSLCIEHIDELTTSTDSRIIPFSGYKVTKIYSDYLPQGSLYIFQDDYYTWIDADYIWNETLSPGWVSGIPKISMQMIGRLSIVGSNPQFWSQWGNNIIIDPIPDGEYPLTVFISDYPETELTNEPSFLPKEFQQCVVMFACYSLSIKLKKWKQSLRYYNIYIRNLKKYKKEYMDRRVENRKIHLMI
ncbi:MAG: hypothetical protein V1709_03870 [Planctomycetota bacterium]